MSVGYYVRESEVVKVEISDSFWTSYDSEFAKAEPDKKLMKAIAGLQMKIVKDQGFLNAYPINELTKETWEAAQLDYKQLKEQLKVSTSYALKKTSNCLKHITATAPTPKPVLNAYPDSTIYIWGSSHDSDGIGANAIALYLHAPEKNCLLDFVWIGDKQNVRHNVRVFFNPKINWQEFFNKLS